jgi:CO/xanthine dehydrogenase Mo-binding subunit
MLSLAFVRSQHAHARIRAIDAAVARAHPGVAAVITAGDLRDVAPLAPRLVAGGFTPTRTPALADGVVHFCGHAVAAVVVESPAVAADARNDVIVDYEPLAAAVSIEDALAAGRIRVRRSSKRGGLSKEVRF